MAVAFDAVGPSSAGTSATAATSLSWSHTCGASATYLVVGVAAGNSASTDTVTCTYNGVSMTNLGLQATNNSAAGYVVLFGLANPATGANTVAFTCTTSSTLSAGSVSFTGSGSIGTPVKAFGSGTSASVSVTGVASTSMVVAAGCSGSGFDAVASVGTTRWAKLTDNNSGAGNGQSGTNTGTGSVAVTFTMNSDWWGMVGVEVIQAGAGAADPGPAPFRPPGPGRIAPGGRWSPFRGDTTTPRPVIIPDAGLAAAAGAAFDATVTISPAAGNAAATGAAGGPSSAIAPTAGNATATGAAGAPTPNVGGAAGTAAGTGVAGAPTPNVQPAAGAAAGAGTAPAPSVTASATPAAGNAAATGTAPAPAVTLGVPAGNAAGSGAANAASVTTSPNIPAGLASGTGAAQGPTANIAPAAGLAAGTGTAPPATVTTSPNIPAGLASGTGSAVAVTATVAAAAGLAAGTGTAPAPTVATSPNVPAGLASAAGAAAGVAANLGVPAGLAAGSGVAGDATAATSGNANAPAGLAAGTGTALAPSVTISPVAEAATATGAALAPTVSTSPNLAAGNAAGTGAASNPTITISALPAAALGSGAAQPPTVALAVPAGLAAATGTAYDATTSSSSPGQAGAGPAQGMGAALDPTVTTSPNIPAGTASGSGAAPAPTVTVSPTAGAATAAANSPAPATSLNVSAAAATATGAAPAPTITISPAAGAAAAAGAAPAAVAGIAGNAAAAAGSAAALDATASTSSPGQAPAGAAQATGVAPPATVTTSPNIPAGSTAGTGAANPPTVAVSPAAGAATGTGAAQQPTITLLVHAGLATGSSTAHAAVVGGAQTDGQANPTTAAAAGVAYGPRVIVSCSVRAGQARGTGTAGHVRTTAGGGVIIRPGHPGPPSTRTRDRAILIRAAAPTGPTIRASSGASTAPSVPVFPAPASAVAAAPAPTADTSSPGGPPTTPPLGTRFSTGQDLALLDGPSSAPGGSVTVNPGTDLNTVTQANPAGTVFYLTAGVHTFDTVGQFSQVIPKDGNTYIGAPGAKLDGQSVAQYAFTGSASGVTIKYLEVMNFVCPFDEFVVNHNAGDNWTIQYCHIHHCGGAGIGLGTNSAVSYCWLHHNRQYAFSSYKDPVADGATPAISSVSIDHCELSHCGDALDEYGPDGSATFRGRNGNCKFWDTSGITFTNNWMHHSVGTGLWADTNNIGALVESNLFEDNSAVAFFYEISYNFRVRYNTFRRNALVEGVRNNTVGDSFPRAAIYISESGGDSRVTATYAASTIDTNAFVNNWDDIALWESSDRFCNSPANTSFKIYKPLGGAADLAVCNNPSSKTLTVTLTSGSPNFTVTGGTFESTDEGRPVSGTGIPGGTEILEPRTSNNFASGYLGSTGVLTANATASGSITMTLDAGTINTEPAFTDCRWHTQNITVQNNTFDHNRSEVLGAHNTANGNPLVTSGRHAVFSQYGTFPSWSPYQATTIQDLIVTQNNVWQNNTYRGDYRFLAKDTSNQFDFATWQASPYNQDSGSTYNATPQTGNGGGGVYVPDPPTGVTATAGDGQARVAFVPPVDNGGATLVGYTVTASPGGATATAVSGPIVVTGLTNNTAYTFTVQARTSLDIGTASSASSAVTPTSGAAAFGNSAPWQPQTVSALRKTSTTAYIGFLAPVSNGGATITGYTASATPVGGGSAITASGSASPITITGLVADTAYTYTVTATNSAGTGPASQPV